MNKLLGVDIDAIIKRVLNETLGKEKDMQDQKSSEMKDFKAPPESKKNKNLEEADEDDQPVETQEKADISVSASEIVGLLGRMRSGQSLKGEEVRKNFQDYFNSLAGAERLALKAYMTAITDIVAGATDEGNTDKEPAPHDYGIEMDVEEKKPKTKKNKDSSKSKEKSKEDNSSPIVVGESANKINELKTLRGLK